MKVTTEKFRFPSEQQVKQLSNIRTASKLGKIMLKLKNETKNQLRKIKYHRNTWNVMINGKVVTRFSVYFQCCGNAMRKPTLHFFKQNKFFVLNKQMSNFQHCHFVKISDKNNLNQFEQKQSSNKNQLTAKQLKLQRRKRHLYQESSSSQSQSEQSQSQEQEHQSEASDQQSFNEQSDQDSSQEEQQMREVSNQKHRQLDQKPINNASKLPNPAIFNFPPENELQRLKTFQGRRSLVGILNSMSHRYECNAKYQTLQKIELLKQTGEKIYVILFKFHCCQFGGKFPFMRYISRDKIKYTLQSYSLAHYRSLNHPLRKNNFQTNNHVKSKGVEKAFDFPLKQQMQLLKEFKNSIQIEQRYDNLKSKPHHRNNQVRYMIKTRSFQENGKYISIVHLYFPCCKQLSQKPYISYVSVDGKSYFLQENYTLRHEHKKNARKFGGRRKKIHVGEDVQKKQMQQNKDVSIQKQNSSSNAPESKQKTIKQIFKEDQAERFQYNRHLDRHLRFLRRNQIRETKTFQIKKKRYQNKQKINLNQHEPGQISNEVIPLGVNLHQQSKRFTSQNQKMDDEAGNSLNFREKFDIANEQKQEGEYSQSIEYVRFIDEQALNRNQQSQTDIIFVGKSHSINRQKFSGGQTLAKREQADLCEIVQSRLKLTQKLKQTKPLGQNDSIIKIQKKLIKKKSDIQYYVFKWFQRFNQFLFQSLLLNSIENINIANIRQASSFSNQITISNDVEEAQVWKQRTIKFVSLLDFQIIPIKQLQNLPWKISNFQNKIFWNKQQPVLNAKFSATVYLALFNLQIGSQSSVILIGYRLDAEFQPHLLFITLFSIPAQSQQFMIEQLLQQNQMFLDEKISLAIKTVCQRGQTQNVILMYSSFDKQMIQAINYLKNDKIADQQQININFHMNLQCIKGLFRQNISPKDKLFAEQIVKKAMFNSKNQQTRLSFKYLKDIFGCIKAEKQFISQKHAPSQAKSTYINPRQLLGHYIKLSQLFSTHPTVQYKFIGLSYILSTFDHQIQANNNRNPIHRIQTIFKLHQKSFESFQQLFIFIHVLFSDYSKSSRILTFSKEIQLLSFRQILDQFSENSQTKQVDTLMAKFQSIFDHQITQIAKTCDRIVLNTMYRMIAQTLHLDIKDTETSQPVETLQGSVMKMVVVVDEKTQQNFCVIAYNVDRMESQGEQNNGKKWFCQCRFYDFTGLPCQHEIICALNHKHVLINEISSCWKSNCKDQK